jgi:1-pyrroline-5-carboxylate dehydrogenase
MAVNEPVKDYAPGSTERAEVVREIQKIRTATVDLPMYIGDEIRRSNHSFEVVEPHAHSKVLGTGFHASQIDARDAIQAALDVSQEWRNTDFEKRAEIFLRAADLLAETFRTEIVATSMLGQSKTVYQAEIDAACELIDFWRFNVEFARQLQDIQPISVSGIENSFDHRPLEGFVYAISPFNFTSIAANLPTAPALMGNVTIWKPAMTQMLSANVIMKVLREAGLPAGVVNLVSGDGVAVSDVALQHRELAGIHFTGSTSVFQKLWQQVAMNLPTYRSYPRLVGETGGKDFIVAHKSADPEVTKVALIRGAYEYQGQKCSAASRAYISASLWNSIKDDLVSTVNSITQGDVSDFQNFMSAVIDEKSFRRNSAVIDRAHAASDAEVLAGGVYSDEVGYFVRPTLIQSTNPEAEWFTTEYFGPFLAVYVFADDDYENVVRQLESVAPYALTGSILAQDESIIEWTSTALRFAAGNFYVNDKPTGAVVGQQPFGGSRASGTNDKAGAIHNLMRWVSPRAIKRNLHPPTAYPYPHMG